MSMQLTSRQVWEEVEKESFAVLGMVTSAGESRTVGIVYVVDDHRLYIGADRSQWKVKHIERNPHVSLTICSSRRVPFMPWITVPAATITFSGRAAVLDRSELGSELLERLYRHDQAGSEWCAIEVIPERDFITYGVGVSLLQMRHPEQARARVPVSPIDRLVR